MSILTIETMLKIADQGKIAYDSADFEFKYPELSFEETKTLLYACREFAEKAKDARYSESLAIIGKFYRAKRKVPSWRLFSTLRWGFLLAEGKALSDEQASELGGIL